MKSIDLRFLLMYKIDEKQIRILQNIPLIHSRVMLICMK